MRKYNVLMTFLINCIINFVIMYFAPTLASFLQDEYGAKPANVGMLMSVFAFTYIITSVGVTFIRNHKRGWLLTATSLIGIGFIFMGPDYVLSTHNLGIVLAA